MRLRGPIDLAHSLQGGQAFLWTRAGDCFTGRIEGRPVTLTQSGPDIIVDQGAREAVERYLRLEPADAARRKRLAKDPALAPAMAALPGLRLLRQDPWETTVAFLTSANNNVLRIEGILRSLVRRLGRAEEGKEGSAAREGGALSSSLPPFPDSLPSPFPTAERVARARESTLRACGLGYRAPFLRDTARMVASGDVDLAALRGRPWLEVREALLELPGVGPKVADCIALFALDCDEAFPMDRWMLRAVASVAGRELKPAEAIAWAHARWGGDAGLAQQYLFHAARLAANAPGTRRVAP